MATDRYPCDTPSQWGQNPSERMEWCTVLEATGIRRVRVILEEKRGGERAAITVGGVMMTKGYAQKWLAWYDQKKEERDTAQEARKYRWQRAGVIVSVLVAIATGINWLWDKPWFKSLLP